MNFYPDALKAIVVYIEALNEADKKAGGAEFLPYMSEIKLTDSEGTAWGTLRDEIGGSWSWFPPKRIVP